MYIKKKTHIIDGDISITQISMLSDNYSYLIYDDKDGTASVVDPSSADSILEILGHYDMQLDYIICTHHHFDHIGGIPGIVKEFPDVKVMASRKAVGNIPKIDIMLDDDQIIKVSQNLDLRAIATPGHTNGSMCFFSDNKNQPFIFTGDTLFSFGCGKVFEGTYKQMYNSIARLQKLPDNTLVFCGHEYTLANLQFAKSVDPENSNLKELLHQVLTKINNNDEFIVPTTIGQEKKFNPFMRARSLKEFIKLRKAKDQFVAKRL